MEGEPDPAPSASDEFFNNSVLTRGSATLTSETPLDETQTQDINLSVDSSVTSGRENAEEESDLQEPDTEKSDRNQDSELKEDLNSLALLEARSEQLDSQIDTAKKEEDSQKSSQLEQEVSTVAQSSENIEEDTTQSCLHPSGIQSDVTSNNDSESNENEDQEKRSFGNGCQSVDSVSVGGACTPTVLDSGSEPTGNGALQTTSSADPETAEKERNAIPTTSSSTSETTENSEKEQIQGITKERPIESLYHIKWIKWKGINTPIVTQNENGPCPLLAIVNVLLLQRRINIPPLQEIVTAGQLMEYIGDCILEEAPKRLSEGAQLNYEQNMHDAIAIMNKLQTGLDVNVRFTGVSDFEFTPECIVFDLLSIGLYHGWLIDPQNTHIVLAVGLLSYNQLVEKIIASKQAGASSQLVSEGLIGESYLEQTASQLTYHGLCELNSRLQADQLCVFFRNNHFSTLYKHKDELFLLVTDQGFLTEGSVVWESLSNVEGDSYFVNAEFRSLPTTTTSPPLNNGISQEDRDYLVALSLHNEQEQAARMAPTQGLPAASANPHPPLSQEFSSIQQIQANQEWSDLQLAMQLQQEEQRQQPQVQQQQRINPQPQQSRPPASRPVGPPPTTFRTPANQRPESNEKCVIL